MIRNNELTIPDIKFSSVIKLLMLLFSAIFVFSSIDIYQALDSTIKLNSIFIMGFLHEKFLSIFEIVFIVLTIILLIRYNKMNGSSSLLIKILFSLIIINYFLKMLNPNNDSHNPILGMPLFSDISNYSFILLAYFSLFINERVYIKYILKIYNYIGILLTIRVVFLLILWFMGKGNYQFGANSTLTESDVLFVIAFYQIIFYTLYTINKKIKYLILWILYLIVLILSFRRSALSVAILSNILCYILFVNKSRKITSKIVLFLGIIIIYIGINNIEKIQLPVKYQDYILRFVSAIPGVSLSATDPNLNDSGHWNEASNTALYAIGNIGFWGYGYRQNYNPNDMYIQGQSAVVHNVYVATWAKYGFFMLIFYIIIILIIIYNILKSFFIEKINNFTNYKIKIALACFLLVWFGVLVTNPLIMIDESLKVEFFWFSIFTLIIRLSQEDSLKLLNNEISKMS